jgi:hypothetical protein
MKRSHGMDENNVSGTSMLSLNSDVRGQLLLEIEDFFDLCLVAQSNMELRRWMKHHFILDRWIAKYIGPIGTLSG